MKKICSINDLQGLVCDVLGMGISNIPLIKILLDTGAVVRARDKKSRSALSDEVCSLEERGVKFILGENYLCKLDGDVIFRSPGIRPDLPEIQRAVERGSLLLSEMELFMALSPANMIGITGSDGKTTTTTLTHLFLSEQCKRQGEASKAYVGGNIGTPLLPLYSEMAENDYAVIELSSFQLMTLRTPLARAAITNITMNHMNWHLDSMEEYTRAKCNIFGDNTLLVLNADNQITSDIAKRRGYGMILFSSHKHSFNEIVTSDMSNTSAVFIRNSDIIYSDGNSEQKLLCIDDILIKGIHNIENYMTAMAITYGLVDLDIYTKIAKSFGGVEHRLEFVRELNGIKYYNSSIDSSPTRTCAALSALDGKKIVICGGSDKNTPFEILASSLCTQVKCVVLTGETAPKIKKAILASSEYAKSKLILLECEDFDDAVKTAKEAAASGDTVILSPACASFDRFSNFEERGNHFKALVMSFK